MVTTTKNNLFIVGLGASAGGLEALQSFFSNISNQQNMAFVVIQHLSPNFDSLMADLLKKHTQLSLITPSRKTTIKPNCIYLTPKNKNLIYKNGNLELIEKNNEHKLNLPIDIFFQSLGENAGEFGIGVVLSGTGTDGSRGIKSIKEHGGTVMVQSPQSAKFDGMPRSSLKLGIIDATGTPEELAVLINNFSDNNTDFDFSSKNSNHNNFQEILQLLKNKFKIDFELYRSETLTRRTQKRMQLGKFKTISAYYKFLQNNEAELEQLLNDYLIGVTKFFRDTDAWESIKNDVIPMLINQNNPSGTIRVWSVGTSTGEEAYTIAILLEEAIKKTKNGINYKIFATDASKNAIEFASKGIYNDNIGVDIPTPYLQEYFVKKDYTYQIKKNIREKIIFTKHDCLSDPPIIGVDLLICRNLLIYIKPDLQKMLLNNFQFSLNHRGFLFLGISENVRSNENVFTNFDKNHKIFINSLKRKLIPQTQLTQKDFQLNDTLRTASKQSAQAILPNTELFFNKILLEEFNYFKIIVTNDLDILYTHGDADKYLSVPKGVINKYNLAQMLSTNEAVIMRNGIKTCLSKNQKVTYKNFDLTKGKQSFTLQLNFTPRWLNEFNQKVVVIDFLEIDNKPLALENKPSSTFINSSHTQMMELEIKELKYELQQTKEELEAANEELQASNEELLGANEELQSSNEELQSVNEELYAVNNEFQLKIEELTQLNDDINNLFNNIDIAIIYLDKDLNIRKLTPRTENLFHFSSADIGRSITHFSSWLGEELFYTSINEVVKTKKIKEYQVNNKNQQKFLLRIVPYLNAKKEYDGVVITLTNITEYSSTQKKLQLQENLLLKTEKNAHISAFAYNQENEIFISSGQLNNLIGLKKDVLVTLNLLASKFIVKDEKKIIQLFQSKTPGEIEVEIASKGYFKIKTFTAPHQKNTFTGIIQNITEYKKLSVMYEEILETSFDGFFNVNPQNATITSTNTAFCNLTGYTKQELVGLPLWKLDFHEEEANTLERLKYILKIGYAEFETIHVRKDGTTYDALVKVRHNKAFKDVITVFVEDITQRKKWEKDLTFANNELKKINQELDSFVYRTSHDLRAPLASSLGLIELLKLESKDSEQVNELINMQEKALNSMDDFIKDILTYSRNARHNEKKDEINMETEIKSVLNILKHMPGFDKIEKIIEVNCIDELYSDLFRLNIIFNNLLSNAIKFADLNKKNPFVKIQAFCDKNWFTIKIIDNGIGIGDEHKQHIFDMFYRANSTVDGTGIGTYIVKDSVEKLGGEISYTSQLGEGTTFVVKLPNKSLIEVNNK